MKKNKINIIWAISLLVIGVATIILSGLNIIGLELPNTLTRIIGIVELIALPVLVFTTVKRIKKQGSNYKQNEHNL